MKKFIIFTLACLCFTIVCTDNTFAAKNNPWLSINDNNKMTHKISIGAKSHFDYANFSRIPIEDDDYSYLMFYELHNDFAYWQIGGSFTPGPDDDRFDHVITPQINLIAKDRIFRIGMGALISDIKIDGDDDWTRVYWQAIFGLGIPIGDHFGIDIYGHYLFKSWNQIEKPASEAPQVSVMVNFAF